MRTIVMSLAVTLSACAQASNSWEDEPFTRGVEQVVSVSGKPLPPPPLYRVHDLANSIATDLTRHYQNSATRLLAVTTPVLLEQFEQSSPFARQLGEALISAMHTRSINVVELNAAERIKVSPQGNLVLSRNFAELARTVSVEHILVTTLSYGRDTIEFNSRIVTMADHRVLSTSQGSVPANLLIEHVNTARGVSMEAGRLYRHDGEGRGRLKEWGQQ